MRSSYSENNYGDVFYSIISAWKPIRCVELGVLDGYSTYHIARGLKKNKSGRLESYDLWEDYPFKHGKMEEVQTLIDVGQVSDYVELRKGDAYKVFENYEDHYLTLLHIDISNTGKKIKELINLWDVKMDVGGIILIEGGTEERDRCEWMVKYGATPIKPEIESNPIINSKYVYGTYLRYPGLTFLLKKRH